MNVAWLTWLHVRLLSHLCFLPSSSYSWLLMQPPALELGSCKNFYFESTSLRVRSIAIQVSVCLFVGFLVCLSVRSHASKTTRSNFTKFSVHVVCGRGSVLFWRQCKMLCTSGFVEWMGQNHRRRVFRLVRQLAAPGRSLPFPTASYSVWVCFLKCAETLDPAQIGWISV